MNIIKKCLFPVCRSSYSRRHRTSSSYVAPSNASSSVIIPSSTYSYKYQNGYILCSSLSELFKKSNRRQQSIYVRSFATVKLPPPPPSPSPSPSYGVQVANNKGGDNDNDDEHHHRRASNIDEILGLSKNVNYSQLAVDDGPNSKKTPKVGRLRQLWNQYGFAAIGTYFCLYWGTLGGMYIGIEKELVSATLLGFESNEDCVRVACDSFKAITDSDLLETVKQSPSIGKFLMSLLMTEFTEPLRIGATFLITPKIARFIKKAPSDSNEKEAK